MLETDDHRDPFAGRGETSAARLALFCLIAVGLMVADHHGHYLDRVRQSAGVVVYPLYQAINWPLVTSRRAIDTFSDYTALAQRNRDLQSRWLTAQARLNKMAALEEENIRLRALLDSSPQLGERVVVAELIAVDLEPFTHRVVLNRGSRDGVFVGQPIADAGGILGQVESVTLLTSFVRLITDPSHAIPVAVNRTGFRTIAYGSGQTDQLIMRDVPRSADIRGGDLLVSSGLGGRFPPGFPVAEVNSVQQEPGAAFLTVTARPLAAIDHSREVLLVWPQEPRQGEDPQMDEPEQPTTQNDTETP